MQFFILHTRTQVPFPSLLPNTLTLGLSVVQVSLPNSVSFSRGARFCLCSFSSRLKSTPFAHYSSRTEHSEAFPGCARSDCSLRSPAVLSRVHSLRCVISICPLSCADASGHPRAHDLTPHRRGLALRRDFPLLPCRFSLPLRFPLSPAKPSRTDENLTASA